MIQARCCESPTLKSLLGVVEYSNAYCLGAKPSRELTAYRIVFWYCQFKVSRSNLLPI
jgi:hypothetical protein